MPHYFAPRKDGAKIRWAETSLSATGVKITLSQPFNCVQHFPSLVPVVNYVLRYSVDSGIP